MSKDREYMRRYMLERYHRRRDAAIVQLGGECAACGSKENLQIDHKDPGQKTADIAKILSGGSEQRVQAELMKCQLLCGGCHNQKTIAEAGKEPAETHGTDSMYQHRGCRCDLCRAAHSAVHAEWRRRKAGL